MYGPSGFRTAPSLSGYGSKHFVFQYKLYLPSEEELLRELNQEYQALEVSKVAEENIGDMEEK